MPKASDSLLEHEAAPPVSAPSILLVLASKSAAPELPFSVVPMSQPSTIQCVGRSHAHALPHQQPRERPPPLKLIFLTSPLGWRIESACCTLSPRRASQPLKYASTSAGMSEVSSTTAMSVSRSKNCTTEP